jgi:hypothetical protein
LIRSLGNRTPQERPKALNAKRSVNLFKEIP